jgi:hypothetical protein
MIAVIRNVEEIAPVVFLNCAILTAPFISQVDKAVP